MKFIFKYFRLFLIVLLFSLDKISAKEIPLKHGRFMTNAVIHQLSEMLKGVIINGNSEKGIPILDPYKLDDAHFNLPGDLISLKVNVNDATLSGLGNYELNNSDFIKDEISVDLNIVFPSIYFKAEFYEMEGTFLGAFPLSGIGALQIEMQNCNIWSKVYLKQSDDEKSIIVNRFRDTEFTVERFVSHTEFDGNIDNIFNAMVEDLMAEYLTRFSKFIAAKYNDTVIQILNPFLNHFESWKIISVML